MENSTESRAGMEYSAELEILQKKSMVDLKAMAKELGVPTSSKLRRKSDWVQAIYSFCRNDNSQQGRDIPDTSMTDVSESEQPVQAMNRQPQQRMQRKPQNNYQQKKQYQTNSSGNYGRQQNFNNDYNRQGGYQNYQQSYPQNYQQNNPYQQQRQQNDRAAYQQNNYNQDYQRKKTYNPNEQYRPNMGYQQYSSMNGEQQYYPYQPPMQPQYMQNEEMQQRPAMEHNPPVMNNMQNQQPPMMDVDDTVECEAVLEVMQDGYGFLRSNNYLPGQEDVYVSNQQVRRFKLHTGDLIKGKTRHAQTGEKYPPLMYINTINGETPEVSIKRKRFDELIPVYPNERLTLEYGSENNLTIRLVDLFAPIGKGQRGLIVSQPKAGKTTLLKEIANGILSNHPDVHLIVLLIDERPEEVTDIKRSLRSQDENRCEVIYSTFDELPDHHTRVAEMVMERSMRLVEHNKDVVVLMDSITRLARAYNITMPTTGKTLSGGMDPSALFKPKRFFGAARNIEDGGSLTIIATALVETGSRMDDMVYEEFKGTGNMEIHLDRKLSEKRIFPAVDIYKSGTRHDDLLLTEEEFDTIQSLRRILSVSNTADVTEQVISMIAKSSSNKQFIDMLKAWFAKQEKEGYFNAK